jgi:hypothetical protein
MSSQDNQDAIWKRVNEFRARHIDEPAYTEFMSLDTPAYWLVQFYEHRFMQKILDRQHGYIHIAMLDPDPINETEFALLETMAAETPSAIEDRKLWLAAYPVASEIQLSLPQTKI